MNVLKAILSAFEQIGKLFVKAFKSAIVRGLSEEVLHTALVYVHEAFDRFADNAQRREWAVAALMTAARIPESIARLAIEMAVQAAKKELDEHVPNTPVTQG